MKVGEGRMMEAKRENGNKEEEQEKGEKERER